MRPFRLVRFKDISGISGTGVVAQGVEFDDGSVVIHWPGDKKSTVIWDNIEDAVAVHGHGGQTKFYFFREVNSPGSDLCMECGRHGVPLFLHNGRVACEKCLFPGGD